MAHYKAIRTLLLEDALLNEGLISERGASLLSPDAGKRKKTLQLPKNAEYLFQYAKNRAFASNSDYQTRRIGAYFRLSGFFRGLFVTLPLAYLLLLTNPVVSGSGNLFRTGMVFLLLMIFSFISNYRYRIYYCRMVLGTAYKIPE